MTNLISKWKDQVREELSWADLLIKAAAGDADAYKELIKKDKEERDKDH